MNHVSLELVLDVPIQQPAISIQLYRKMTDPVNIVAVMIVQMVALIQKHVITTRMQFQMTVAVYTLTSVESVVEKVFLKELVTATETY